MSQVYSREDGDNNFSTTIELTTDERNQLEFLLNTMASKKLTPGLSELRSQLRGLVWPNTENGVEPYRLSMADVYWRRLYEVRAKEVENGDDQW
jgi:hypothetical protein